MLLFYSTVAFSQKQGDKEPVDAKYKCTYSIKYINDTIKMTQGTEDGFILLIGDNLTYEYSYISFHADSLLKVDILQGKRMLNYFLTNFKY